MNVDGVIFDLDGTLLASESVYLRAWRTAAGEIGVEMPFELHLELLGMNPAGAVATLAERWNSSDLAADFVATAQNHYDSIVSAEGHSLRTGIVSLLEFIILQGIPMGVATSSVRSVAELALERTGLSRYFRALACGDEVKRGKPDPEIYELAAGRIGVDPARCVAFEDSEAGTNAAIAAGMTVFYVPELEGGDMLVHERVIRLADHSVAIGLLARPQSTGPRATMQGTGQ